nr:hypothetical protein [Rhodococcus qingshengii]
MTDSQRRSDTSVIAIAAVTASGMIAATGHGFIATVATTALCAPGWPSRSSRSEGTKNTFVIRYVRLGTQRYVHTGRFLQPSGSRDT